MITYRYTIEVKDQYGWCDYVSFADIDEAKARTIELHESFGADVRLVDTENMIEVM